MRFSKLAVAVSVCAFAALGGGCSGSTDGAATVGPVALDQLPQTLANAMCDSLAPCCKAANVPYLESGCKSTVTDGWSTFIAQMSSGHTRYDADAAGRCVAAAKNEIASCKELGDGALARARAFSLVRSQSEARALRAALTAFQGPTVESMSTARMASAYVSRSALAAHTVTPETRATAIAWTLLVVTSAYRP
jgi:hypothetical protein